MDDLNLKRNYFTQSIRKTQRDRIRLTIRQAVQDPLPHHPPDHSFSSSEFALLRKACKEKYFAHEAISPAMNYLFPSQDNTARIMEGETIKFLQDVADNIARRPLLQPWREQVLGLIRSNVAGLLEAEIKGPAYQKERGGELGSLYALSRCFHELLSLIASDWFFFPLWPAVAAVANEEFTSLAYKFFQQFLMGDFQNLECRNLSVAISALQKFAEHRDQRHAHASLHICDRLLQTFTLGGPDLAALLNALICCLDSQGSINEPVVRQLVKETRIVGELLTYLDQLDDHEAALSIALLISKLFCTQEELCVSTYEANKNVIQVLQKCLPVSGQVSHERLSDALERAYLPIQLSHHNQRLTRMVLFALSNIVATGDLFSNICLRTGLFSTFMYLYPAVPPECRLEISFCCFNMLETIQDPSVPSIMLDWHFAHVLPQMLTSGQTRQQQNAIRMITRVCEILPFERPGPSYILPTKQDFINQIISKGVLGELEKLICSKDRLLGDLAEEALNLIHLH